MCTHEERQKTAPLIVPLFSTVINCQFQLVCGGSGGSLLFYPLNGQSKNTYCKYLAYVLPWWKFLPDIIQLKVYFTDYLGLQLFLFTFVKASTEYSKVVKNVRISSVLLVFNASGSGFWSDPPQPLRCLGCEPHWIKASATWTGPDWLHQRGLSLTYSDSHHNPAKPGQCVTGHAQKRAGRPLAAKNMPRRACIRRAQCLSALVTALKIIILSLS